jgi:hypothetical protein
MTNLHTEERQAADDDEAMRLLVREELERLHGQTRLEVALLTRAVAAVFAAALVLYLAAVFVSLMAVYILGELIEPWIGAAIVGSSIAITAAVLLWQARRYYARVQRRLGE